MNPIFQAILGVISGPLDGILSRFFPSAEEKQKAANEIQKMLAEQQGAIVAATLAAQQGQIDTNKEEAKSASVFVAGWRPFIGWVCGSALAWQFVLAPFATYGLGIYAAFYGVKLPPLPVLDSAQLYPVLMGMLGLGTMRTVERINGVARNSLKDNPSA